MRERARDLVRNTVGYKIYGADEPKRSRINQFCENFFATFIAFSGCIGGWLVYFGMSPVWMITLTFVIASAVAVQLSKK